MVAQLLEIVDEPDGTKHQGKQEHYNVVMKSVLEILPARGHHRHGDTQNKHQAAHGGGTLFGHMPGGSVLPDGLSGLEPAQHRDQNLSGNGGHAKGHNEAENICHVETSRSSFSFVPGSELRRIETRYYTTPAGRFPVLSHEGTLEKYWATISRSSMGYCTPWISW